MKDWAERHILLTREERWLIAGIVLIFLVGLGARYLEERHPDVDRAGDPPARHIVP